MRSFILLIIFLFSPFINLKAAEKNNLDEYYKEVVLGEKSTNLYYGPLDARGEFNDSTGNLDFLDDLFSKNYMLNQFQDGLGELPQFWSQEVMEKSICPNKTLSDNIIYIRYLYRLVSISYLFEELRLFHQASSELGFDVNACQMKFDDIFGKCQPKSSDMKKFKERVMGKFSNEIEKIKIDKLSTQIRANMLKGFRESQSLSTDVIQSRMYQLCRADSKNCRHLTDVDIQNNFSQLCSANKSVIKKLCNESDHFFGLSQSPVVTDLIKNSNAFTLINQSGMGEECLRRYAKISAHKENVDLFVNKQFPLIHYHLIKKQGRFPQGELFLPGALKEFDMKGLSDFLTALKPKVVEPIVIKKLKPKPIKKVVVVAPKPEPVVMNLPQPTPEPAPVVEAPRLSQFNLGLAALAGGNQEFVVNMDEFRDDFEFSSAMIAELTGVIKKFQTRSALMDMKSFDTLGSAEAPMGLIFLKFLLDTENHQGLYNITSVLGEKFYVMNDLENQHKPIYIHLKNDNSTNNRWQIIIIKKPQKNSGA